jgi:hypothetical protein
MVFTSLIKSGVEHMMGNKKEPFNNNIHEPTLTQVIVILVWLMIILTIGKYLWNEHAVKCINILSPLKSIWQLLGIIILFDLIHPVCY